MIHVVLRKEPDPRERGDEPFEKADFHGGIESPSHRCSPGFEDLQKKVVGLPIFDHLIGKRPKPVSYVVHETYIEFAACESDLLKGRDYFFGLFAEFSGFEWKMPPAPI